MIILWKQKVYTKIKTNLLEAFAELVKRKRSNAIERGKIMTEKKSSNNFHLEDSSLHKYGSVLPKDVLGNMELIGIFVQSVVDLSVNELNIHYLGSTKLELGTPYKELGSLIYKLTK